MCESEVEDEGADFAEGMYSTGDEYKNVQNRQSCRSEWCDVKEHEINTSSLPRTCENRIITR